MRNSKNSLTDLIKYVAAVLVIYSHSYNLSQNSQDILSVYSNNAITFGGIGVSILFAFSGYYIANSLRKKGSNHYIYNRLKRMIPSLFLVVILSTFVLGPLITTNSIIDYLTNKSTYLYLLNIVFVPIHNLPGVFLGNIFNSTVNGSLWTMGVQFGCYIFLLFACKIKFLSDKKKIYYILLSGLFVGTVFLCSKILGMEILKMAIRPVLVFCVGALLNMIEYNKNNKLLYFSIFLTLACFIINNKYLINFSVVVLLPFILIWLISNCSIRVNRKVLSCVILSSYELYLVGFPIQQLICYLFGGSMNIFTNFVISLPISIVMAIMVKKISDSVTKRIFVKESKI